ncbi:hypothetical protein DPMN_128649 [Dreissena polymorpha]|uniref:Uncharacterized protein n=1 Tax=Dreissena polymorpha TaxID=45954 RepID=A0A9D4H4C8_DREPO|nr:hypothetical protein DPMN_128649 [Dreissena polymorpha]
MSEPSAVRRVTKLKTSVTNRHRSAADVFFRSSDWRRPMIARTSDHLVASGGVQINFLYHNLFYPTSGPGRIRVEIEKRSEDQRTVIARRAPDIGFIVRVSERASSVVHRAEALRQSDGRRPMYMPLGNTFTFANTRSINPMSGDRRAIPVR